MKNLLIILLSVVLMGCIKYQSEPLTPITDSCLEIEKYDKTLCLTAELDSVGNYIYIERKKAFKGQKERFINLTVHIMMVVEIDDHMVTLSNPTNAIEKIYFEKIPKIEDIFYVVCTEALLKETRLITSP